MCKEYAPDVMSKSISAPFGDYSKGGWQIVLFFKAPVFGNTASRWDTHDVTGCSAVKFLEVAHKNIVIPIHTLMYYNFLSVIREFQLFLNRIYRSYLLHLHSLLLTICNNEVTYIYAVYIKTH